jgi:AhpD family alkylhydroperoxidase
MELLKDLKSPWTGRNLLKQMKEAKTGKEMVDSWSAVMPSEEDHSGTVKAYDFFAREAPEMIKYYAHEQTIYMYENCKLDPKVVQLIMTAVCAAQFSTEGINVHARIARARGATKEEVMWAIYIAAYECAKNSVVAMAEGVTKAFTDTTANK